MKDEFFLGLGSNLGNRLGQLQSSLAGLQAGGCRLVASSSVYETPPWGFEEQPAFLNAVVQVSYEGDPMELLQLAMQVEHALGRVRAGHWGPRAIDIDLLACGQLQLRGQRLVLPHPLLQERAFVLLPWAEIAPEFEVVGLGMTVATLLARLPKADMESIVTVGILSQAL
jgi:2-amino-4-hydroxy-6-hydroxymethyldihydropteridine diphosphokinase